MRLKFITLFLVSFVFFCSCRKKKPESENPIDLAIINSQLANAKNEDVVYLPIGTCTLKTPILISKSVSLIGAGVGKTNFINSVTTANQPILQFKGSDASTLRISGISFQTNDTLIIPGFIKITGDCKQFRIDHCSFKNCGSSAIYVNGTTYGLIDHCEFYNAGNNNIQILSEKNGDMGDASWIENEPMGTANSVFVEDCSFSGSSSHLLCAMDGFCGSRYVFRHNNVHTEANYPFICMHGSYGYGRGGYSAEIYNNTFNGNGNYFGIYMRGGRGVIFNNIIVGQTDLPLCLGEYRAFVTKAQYVNDYPNTSLHPNWTELDDEKNDLSGYCDNYYPTPDQVNKFYLWNNTYRGNPIGASVRDIGLQKNYIQLNRDYFEIFMPGYTPYPYPHPLVK